MNGYVNSRSEHLMQEYKNIYVTECLNNFLIVII